MENTEKRTDEAREMMERYQHESHFNERKPLWNQTPEERAQAVEHMRECEQHLVMEMTRILVEKTPADGLHWRDSMTDLMLVTHMVWEAGTVRDERGQRLTFKQLAHRAADIMHRKPMANPSQCVYRDHNGQRKVQDSYLERASWLRYHTPVRQPLRVSIVLAE